MNNKLKIMAIILARGGSTGVPNKNIKEINGKPLIAYTIDIAKQSKYINKIIVATDSEKIKTISEKYGAEVPFIRPNEMSQKLSRAYGVYKYFLEKLKNEQNYRPDIFVCLFSTSYSKTVENVDDAICKLINTKCDWVFTVTEVEHHPYRCFTPISEDKMINFCKDVKSYDIWGNRQELPLTYRINGNAFVTWTENIEKYETYNVDMVDYSNSDIRYVVNLEENSMDIDTPLNFEFAKFFLSKKNRRK